MEHKDLHNAYGFDRLCDNSMYSDPNCVGHHFDCAEVPQKEEGRYFDRELYVMGYLQTFLITIIFLLPSPRATSHVGLEFQLSCLVIMQPFFYLIG